MPECQLKNEICEGRCTGYDGKRIWKKRMDITKTIECESCREEGINLEKFSHDIVNAKLGKPIFDKKNFKKHVQQIKCICEKTGAC